MRNRLPLPILLFSMVLASCSSASHDGQSATFKIVQQYEPRSLNPALESGPVTSELAFFFFSYLLKYDDAGRLIPDAATAVPSLSNGGISRDGRTITYHLHRGIRFSDGATLSAEDCVWSINAINDRANNVQDRYGYDVIERAEAPDPSTLVLHLKMRFAPIIATVLSAGGVPILPKHVLAHAPDFNRGSFNTAPVGSGPYVLVEWIRGDRIALRSNPLYWRGKASIERIDLQFVANPQTAINLLQTHEVDGYHNAGADSNFNILSRLPGYHVTSMPVSVAGGIIFNTQSGVTSDARVRHALAEAIDVRGLIAKTYHGGVTSADAGRAIFSWAYDRTAYPDVPYNPRHARELLEAAGWKVGPENVRLKNGAALSVLLIVQAGTPGDAVLANSIVEYERAIGASVTIKQFSSAQMVAPSSGGGPVYGGKFQMALYRFGDGPDPDVTDQFACKNIPPHGFNKSRICNKKLDSLLDAARTTYDRSRRTALYANIQRLLYSELPVAVFYQAHEDDTFTTRLRSQTSSLSGTFWNVGSWHMELRR
jgi:peptide/nickel transport system substrate-binding protein